MFSNATFNEKQYLIENISILLYESPIFLHAIDWNGLADYVTIPQGRRIASSLHFLLDANNQEFQQHLANGAFDFICQILDDNDEKGEALYDDFIKLLPGQE